MRNENHLFKIIKIINKLIKMDTHDYAKYIANNKNTQSRKMIIKNDVVEAKDFKPISDEYKKAVLELFKEYKTDRPFGWYVNGSKKVNRTGTDIKIKFDGSCYKFFVKDNKPKR